ncbi:hypothetical protein [Cribrihabitans pelagius]|uniref:hypothetical protein n=1 Tax=Cribrihabitans pelagius TaxID=1765746 RepID=UPI003B5B8899
MPEFNEMFALSVDDMDLIETALRRRRDELADAPAGGEGPAQDTEAQLRRIHELLGRLHNQKVFYYPRDGVYVGG